MIFEKIAPDSAVQNKQNTDNHQSSSTLFAPRSPEGPPPIDYGSNNGDDDDSVFLARMLKVREVAVRLAGGEDMWDILDEDEADDFKEKAEKFLDSER